MVFILNRYKKLFLIILITLITFLLIKSIATFKNYDRKRVKDIEFNKVLIRLNECFDLKNRNIRGIENSINLIEYCMDKYGIDK
tara:strand:+ start:760 stop:1011 length:252 start_codon:yes stop_codon:yes gene_type:complete